jgi:hypothetical protein
MRDIYTQGLQGYSLHFGQEALLNELVLLLPQVIHKEHLQLGKAPLHQQLGISEVILVYIIQDVQMSRI